MMVLSVTWGRDPNTTTRIAATTRYEFIVYRDEEIVMRKGGFTNSTAAKRAGLKAAKVLVEAAETAAS